MSFILWIMAWKIKLNVVRFVELSGKDYSGYPLVSIILLGKNSS